MLTHARLLSEPGGLSTRTPISRTCFAPGRPLISHQFSGVCVDRYTSSLPSAFPSQPNPGTSIFLLQTRLLRRENMCFRKIWDHTCETKTKDGSQKWFQIFCARDGRSRTVPSKSRKFRFWIPSNRFFCAAGSDARTESLNSHLRTNFRFMFPKCGLSFSDAPRTTLGTVRYV